MAALEGDLAKVYVDGGRPSIAPERRLRVLLFQGLLYDPFGTTVDEQRDDSPFYRWFVELGVADPVWAPTVFAKNRDQLLEANVARSF